MNFISLIISLLLLSSDAPTQHKFDTLDGSYLKIDGLNFTLKKQTIVAKYGKPSKIFEADYECGFLSDLEPGEKYYSLQYPHFKFTGNNKEGYLLEEIRFETGLKSKVTFRKTELTNKTTVKEFEGLFAVKVTGSEKMLYNKGADDAYIFRFVNGVLSEIEYWSPC